MSFQCSVFSVQLRMCVMAYHSFEDLDLTANHLVGLSSR